MALKKLCKANNCCRYAVEGGKYCEEHQHLQRAEDERKLQGKGGYFETARHGMWNDIYNSPRWKAMRKAQLDNYPTCAKCGAEATEVHHLTPHNGDLEIFFDEGNLVSLCHECHAKETRIEAAQRKRQYAEAKRKLWY